ncbi:hypothetical protein LIS04_126 [Listeria phage LIS04]|nr:hypothetical protein LIS04_126 [Listeria phage LIS04]
MNLHSQLRLTSQGDIMNNNRLRVIEGYEMVGKTSFIETYLKDHSKYRPSYEDLGLSNYIPANSRSLLGITILDFLSQNPTLVQSADLAFDRGILTGLQYYDMYPLNGSSINIYLDSFIEMYRKFNASIIYLKHTSKKHALDMFNSSQSRKTNDSAFDPETFEEYWNNYQQFYSKSKLLLNKLESKGIPYIELSSSDVHDVEYVTSVLNSF